MRLPACLRCLALCLAMLLAPVLAAASNLMEWNQLKSNLFHCNRIILHTSISSNHAFPNSEFSACLLSRIIFTSCVGDISPWFNSFGVAD